jgi:hypothetical protein
VEAEWGTHPILFVETIARKLVNRHQPLIIEAPAGIHQAFGKRPKPRDANMIARMSILRASQALGQSPHSQ